MVRTGGRGSCELPGPCACGRAWLSAACGQPQLIQVHSSPPRSPALNRRLRQSIPSAVTTRPSTHTPPSPQVAHFSSGAAVQSRSALDIRARQGRNHLWGPTYHAGIRSLVCTSVRAQYERFLMGWPGLLPPPLHQGPGFGAMLARCPGVTDEHDLLLLPKYLEGRDPMWAFSRGTHASGCCSLDPGR